jgi:hypothetical protein
MKSISEILKPMVAGAKRALWVLGLHAFTLILFLIFIDIVLGGFIFYNYVFLVEKENTTAVKKIIQFDTKTYQNVLLQLQAREQSNAVPPAANQTSPSE